MEFEDASERTPRQDEEHGVESDAGGQRPPLAREEHRLAEHLSRPIASDGLRPIENVDGARDDQIERVGIVAGLIDRLALGECDLPEETGDSLALCLPETTECR